MADVKISELSSAGALGGDELIPVVQSASTVKVLLSAIYTWIVAALNTAGRLIPSGGASGQYLRRVGLDDYDVGWSAAGLVPDSSNTGYVLTQQSGTAGDIDWSPIPPTDPDGAEGNIQYKAISPGTGFAGAAYTSILDDLLHLLIPASAPTAPTDGIKVFARDLASRVLPAFVGPSGLDSALQPFLGRNKIGYWHTPGNAAVAPAGMGLANATTIGTTGTRNVAATNLLTSLRRAYNVSAGTAGASGGWRLGVAQFFRSSNPWGGFFLATRIGEDNVITDSRCFVGLHTSTSAIGNVNPSTLLNIIGVGFDSTESVWSVMHNDGSGTATKVSLGAGYPANTSDEAYDVIIFAPPGQTKVWVQMIRLSTGTSVTTEITSDVPALDTLLAIHVWCNNGPTASAKGINLSTLYIETDY